MVEKNKRPGAFSLGEVNEILEVEKMLGQHDFDTPKHLGEDVDPRVQRRVNQLYENMGEFSARLILTIKMMRNGGLKNDYEDNALEPEVYVCGSNLGVMVNVGKDYVSPGENRKKLEGHVVDCSVFSRLINENPNDGICNCGYGLQQSRNEDYSEMYSEELLERLNVVGASLPWGI